MGVSVPSKRRNPKAEESGFLNLPPEREEPGSEQPKRPMCYVREFRPGSDTCNECREQTPALYSDCEMDSVKRAARQELAKERELHNLNQRGLCSRFGEFDRERPACKICVRLEYKRCLAETERRSAERQKQFVEAEERRFAELSAARRQKQAEEQRLQNEQAMTKRLRDEAAVGIFGRDYHRLSFRERLCIPPCCWKFAEPKDGDPPQHGLEEAIDTMYGWHGWCIARCGVRERCKAKQQPLTREDFTRDAGGAVRRFRA